MDVWPLILFAIVCGICLCCLVCVSEKYDWEQPSKKRTRTKVVKDHKKQTLTNEDGTVQKVTDSDKTRKEEYEVPNANWYEYDEAAFVTEQYRTRHNSALRAA